VSWHRKIRAFWREEVDDDTLRNSSLRFKALLQLDRQALASSSARKANDEATTARAKEIQALFRKLQKWAPRLLEGEALVHFYVDSLLQPLLAANIQRQVWEVLPQVQVALAATSGNKHADRVAEVAKLLVEQLVNASTPAEQEESGEAPTSGNRAAIEPHLETFLVTLWENSAQRGLWQTVHSIEGSLPLLLACKGPAALVTIAQNALTLSE
jgi:hypothetical protein